MRSPLVKFFSVLSCVLLAGCATGYYKEGFFWNGYSDQKLEKDEFLITYRANEHTPQETVREYALRRAAEVTLEQGFRYFSLVEKINAPKEEELVELPLGGERSVFNRSYYPCLHLKIKCYTDKPAHGKIYDAQSLVR